MADTRKLAEALVLTLGTVGACDSSYRWLLNWSDAWRIARYLALAANNETPMAAEASKLTTIVKSAYAGLSGGEVEILIFGARFYSAVVSTPKGELAGLGKGLEMPASLAQANESTVSRFGTIARDATKESDRPSRADAFARAGFEPRQAQLEMRNLPASVPVNDTAVASGFLRSLGYSDTEVAEVLRGPTAAIEPEDRQTALMHLRDLGYTDEAARALLAGPPTKA